MKPLVVPPSAWPGGTPIPLASIPTNQQGNATVTAPKPGGFPASGVVAVRGFSPATKTWFSAMPANDCGFISRACKFGIYRPQNHQKK